MARFNLDDYETVEERIRRFYIDNPDGRIITKNKTTPQDRAVSTWVVKAEIWLPINDSSDRAFDWGKHPGAFLKATGFAFEVDGGGGANQTSALENCETSAIGRALANAGYSGNKRTSREEMQKVERGVTPVGRNWLVEAEQMALAYNVDGLLKLYTEAQSVKVDPSILDKIREFGVAARG